MKIQMTQISSLIICFLQFPLLLLLIAHVNAQPGFLYHFCMNDRGNYTTNSTYKSNLDYLLTSISTANQIDSGFYNFSTGNSTNTLYAIGLCRGDVNGTICRSCLNDSHHLLTQRCPNQKEAIGWYDDCMLRYSNRSIFSTMETWPSYRIWNTANVSSADQFYQSLRTLLYSLKSKAASSNSSRKYAAGYIDGPNFQEIYSLVQCTPDLSEIECDNCLLSTFAQISPCCSLGVGVGAPSCNIRYQLSRPAWIPPPPTLLSRPPSPPTISVPDTQSQGKKNNTSQTVIAVVLPIVGVIILVICISIICFRAKKPQESAEISASDGSTGVESLQFKFETIVDATDNFSAANKIGQGGFGAVYKGKLSSGVDVAVKRLTSRNSSQGDVDFKNEVVLVAKLQHRNLVRLLGFCMEKKERLLIYEFVPNASLDHFIFDPFKRKPLNWEKRYQIITGIARGLLYLHEDSQLRIIHRDLKASNVLLDTKLNPKISDFGTARLFSPDQTQGRTSKIAGTYGYMAPEYARNGNFSVKSDVFSFGVLILEIVTGRKNQQFQDGENTENLLSYAWKLWRNGKVSNLIDPTLITGSQTEMMRCIHIGLLCVEENSSNRPTMAAVVLMLNSNSLTLPVPSRPAFLLHSNAGSDASLKSYNSRNTQPRRSKNRVVEASLNEASITELYPR